METTQAAQHNEVGAIASEITREIVRLHARLYGHGPTKAKSHIGHDFVLCVLEDVFMPAEKTLIAAGNSAQVKSTRNAFQEAVEEDFVAIVERATERTVRAFFSNVHVESETSIELFLLKPAGPNHRAGSSDGSRRASSDGRPASSDGGPPR